MVNIIERETLKAKIGRGDSFVLLEVLPLAAYREAHLPGARHMPDDRVDEWASELIPSKDTEVVVYCANGPCTNSSKAAERLEELGYTNVADYHEGKADWQAAGLPTESGIPTAA